MFFVNEARLIGLIIIAEVRLVKCKATAGRQTADSSTIVYLLVPNTFLDDKTKNLLLEVILLQQTTSNRQRVQGYPFILNSLTNQQIDR